MGRGLKLIGFPHVSAFRDRHGKVRYRYRRAGQKPVYLHGTPGSPDFAAEYDAACSGRTTALIPGASRTAPGTINALAVAIYASAEWRLLSKSTQGTYRGIIERLRANHGDGSVRALQAQHILKMRDRKADAPTAANNLVKVLRWMLAFAVARQWRADNPAVGIKPLKIVSAGFPVWSEADIAQFQTQWPVGTRERLAFDLLLYTAQRSGDVRQMGRQHVQGAAILVRQEKTTGHQTSKEVERYTKARDQKRLAKDAFALIGGTQGEQNLANSTEKLAKPANK